jgi:TldD protein
VSREPDDGLAYFAAFGVDEGMLREAFGCALARGADWAELYFEHRTAHHLALEDGSVSRAHLSTSLGVGVRVVSGDQTGYAYTEELTRERVREAAGAAAVIAQGPAGAVPAGFHVEPSADRYRAQSAWGDVDERAKLSILTRAGEIAMAGDPRIVKVRVGLDHSEGAVLVADSSGRIRFDRQPMARLAVSCTGERAGQREVGAYNLAGREGLEFFDAARIERAARSAAERTAFLFEADAAPAGEFPVVLAAGSAGILLHEAIGHGMEADLNRKGVSVYSSRLNERIAPADVTIVDDGTLPGSRGSINVDDEGVDGQATVLVEQGMLRSYMHDRISAAHYGVAPTGNGRRQSFRHPPLPRMRNTYMLPGPHAAEEIIASVKRGLYAQTFTNGQVRIGAGDFTFYVKTGYWIEDGKLGRPIKDANLIGSGPECLERTVMVGNDLVHDETGWVCGKDGQSVPVSLGMPTIKVSGITVGGVNRSTRGGGGISAG